MYSPFLKLVLALANTQPLIILSWQKTLLTFRIDNRSLCNKVQNQLFILVLPYLLLKVLHSYKASKELDTLPQLAKLSVTMINMNKYLLFIFCTIKLCLAELSIADLKSCKEEKHESKICLTGENGYFKPFPVFVDSDLVLENIIEIDQNKNSISAQFTLITHWVDTGIALSNKASG